jgi:hypothetical protein
MRRFLLMIIALPLLMLPCFTGCVYQDHGYAYYHGHPYYDRNPRFYHDYPHSDAHVSVDVR